MNGNLQAGILLIVMGTIHFLGRNRAERHYQRLSSILLHCDEHRPRQPKRWGIPYGSLMLVACGLALVVYAILTDG